MAKTCVPFSHSHKENEEIYYIISGDGTFVIDNDKVGIKEGDFIKIAPRGKRQLFSNEKGITYICIQVRENSLNQYTAKDTLI